jgi:hypothetical protein
MWWVREGKELVWYRRRRLEPEQAEEFAREGSQIAAWLGESE